MIQQQISYNRQADFFFELINNQLWVHDLKDAVEYQSSEEITIYLTYEFRRGIYAFGFNEPSATKRYFTNNNKKRCYCIKLKGYRSIQFTRLFHFELYKESQVLILWNTREFAEQLSKVAQAFGDFLNVSSNNIR